MPIVPIKRNCEKCGKPFITKFKGTLFCPDCFRKNKKNPIWVDQG